MSLLTVTIDDLRPLQIQGLAAICLRAALRVLPLTHTDCNDSLEIAGNVLNGDDSCRELSERVEKLYQTAANAAAKYRATKQADLGRNAIASAVMLYAIDCIVDLVDDQQAALINGMLALRSCGKLQDDDLSREVMRDLTDLESDGLQSAGLVKPLHAFGPLWSVQQPDWYRL